MATSTRPDVKTSTPGEITEVTRKESGWFNIRFTGQPSLFQTKREDLAGEAARFMRAEKTGRVSHTSRHKVLEDGRAFDDHYFEGIIEETVAKESFADDLAGIPSEVSWGRRTPLPDAWRMALSTGAKLAVDTLPLLQPDSQTPAAQQKLALWWATWIFQQSLELPDDNPLNEPTEIPWDEH